MIHIRFYANMRTIAAMPQLDIAYPGVDSLGQLFVFLEEQVPEFRGQILDRNKRLWPDVPVFINGRNPRLEMEGLDLRLQDGDEISLFSPISSGRMNVEVMREPTEETVK